MTKRISAPKMPRMQLSVEDTRELRLLSADFEKELMRAYEEHLFRNNRRVDERRWRSVRTQEDVHVYRERSTFKEAIHPVQPLFERNALSTSAVEIGPHAAMAANSKMPVLMGTGTMPGMVEDAMFGAAFQDTPSLRTRNAYIKDNTEDSVVLAAIDGPSHDDPFRFLGVVWYYKVYPIALMQNRDLLLLIDIRMAQLSNGERVGINLYHSIQHPDAPVLREHNVLRMEFSLGIIYRQLDNHRFEVFMLSFVDPRGSTPEVLTVQDSAKALLSITNTCDAAFRKKLFWRMRERQKLRGRAVSHPDHDSENHCAMCRKSFSGLFASSGATCQICSKRVCSKCSMTKNIVIETSNKAVTAKPFDFCLVCTLDTKEVPALTIARDEQYERSVAAPRNPLSSSSSLSSSASIGSI